MYLFDACKYKSAKILMQIKSDLAVFSFIFTNILYLTIFDKFIFHFCWAFNESFHYKKLPNLKNTPVCC